MSLAGRRRLRDEPLQEVLGLARSATPSEPSRSHPPAGAASGALPGIIRRADVPAIVADCLDPARGSGPLDCDGSALVDPRLPAIEAIARVALGAARGRRRFRLEHASPALLDLLDLCGLAEVLAAERRRADSPGGAPG